jgi:hypothetical protein
MSRHVSIARFWLFEHRDSISVDADERFVAEVRAFVSNFVVGDWRFHIATERNPDWYEYQYRNVT